MNSLLLSSTVVYDEGFLRGSDSQALHVVSSSARVNVYMMPSGNVKRIFCIEYWLIFLIYNLKELFEILRDTLTCFLAES